MREWIFSGGELWIIRRARTSHAVAAVHLSGVYGRGVTDSDTSSHVLAVIGGVVVRILEKYH